MSGRANLFFGAIFLFSIDQLLLFDRSASVRNVFCQLKFYGQQN